MKISGLAGYFWDDPDNYMETRLYFHLCDYGSGTCNELISLNRPLLHV